MESGLIWFLCLVIPVLAIGLGAVAVLNYRHNPFWRAAQLRMLSVGQVKRNLLSSQDKDGCIIFVVKEFVKKKRLIGKGERITHIISDTYIKKGGKYVLNIKDRKDTVASFYLNTDPEPVYKDERVGK